MGTVDEVIHNGSTELPLQSIFQVGQDHCRLPTPFEEGESRNGDCLPLLSPPSSSAVTLHNIWVPP